MHVVDWLPTLAGLLGRGPEPELSSDGVDLGPLLFDDEPLAERELYWTWGARGDRWALRRSSWKIVCYGPEPTGPDDWQLFDVAADPNEERDVADAHPELVRELHRRFLEQRGEDADGLEETLD